MLERTFVIITLGLLVSCQKEEPKKERHISYSREVRPIIATHCITCHIGPENETGYQISLSTPDIPESFSFPHPSEHPLPSEEQTLFSRWLGQGGEIDQHWAFSELDSHQEFYPPLGASKPQVVMPEGDFREFLRETLAGDLLSEGDKTFSTLALRSGEDSPQSRLELVSHYLGLPLSEPDELENLSDLDWERMTYIFSTPYEELHSGPPKAPTAFRDRSRAHETPFSWEAPDEDIEFQRWLTEKDQLPLIPDLIGAFPFNDGTARNIALGYESTVESTLLKTGPGVDRSALITPNAVPLPSQIALHPLAPFTVSLWFKVQENASLVTLFETMETGRGISVGLQDGYPFARFTRYWPGNAMGVISESPVVIPNRWSHLTLSYDGSRKADGLQLFINGAPLNQRVEANHLIGHLWSPELQPLTVLGGNGRDILTLDEIQVYRRDLSGLEIKTLFDGRTLLNAFGDEESKTPALREYYLSAISPSTQERRVALRKYLIQTTPKDEVPVMESLPRAPAPETPRSSGPNCLDAIDRLGFVTTLIEKDSNLLARATANWIWKEHYGEFLVPSLSYRGTELGNIEKLDALASQLIKLHWDASKLSDLLLSSIDASVSE